MDATVGLKQLAIDCVIGAYASERVDPQRIYVDVSLDVGVEAALASDELSDVVDYTAVAELLTALAEERRFKLLEAFVSVAAGALLETFPEARAVNLEVRKPEAVDGAAHAFVRLRRERGPHANGLGTRPGPH